MRRPLKDWTIEELVERRGELQKMFSSDPSKEDVVRADGVTLWEELDSILSEILAHEMSA
jgi:hypothetical protein